ncbi:MAG: tetratricopeptide repeat protein [Candidatus Riflebacteria bacterium]|nr:tetratricopeptide repeat protein [Candidatus Riflebacteria bacterium]
MINNTKNIAKSLAVFLMLLCFTQVYTLHAQTNNSKLNARIDAMLQKARKTYAKGNVNPAISEYWKILEIAPSLTIAHLELGEIYSYLKIYDRAVELLEPALKRGERELDKETLCNYYCVLTSAYVGLGNSGEANRTLIKAAQSSPRHPRPRTLLGDIYRSNGKYANAAKAYRQATQLDPTYQPALEKLEALKKDYAYELIEAKMKEEKARKEAQSANAKVVTKVLIEPKPVPISEPAAVKASESVSTPVITPEPSTEPEPEPEPTYAPVPQTLDENIDALIAGESAEKERAIEYFKGLGKEGLSKIEDLLYDPDPEVRIIAVRALSSFTDYPKEVKLILLDAGDDPDDLVMSEITAALKEL